MILEILTGVGIAAVVLCAAYLLWARGSGPVSCRKTIENGKSHLVVRANRNLRGVRIEDGKASLVRKNLAKGDRVEFNYQYSMDKARLVVEDEKGRHEVEVRVG